MSSRRVIRELLRYRWFSSAYQSNGKVFDTIGRNIKRNISEKLMQIENTNFNRTVNASTFLFTASLITFTQTAHAGGYFSYSPQLQEEETVDVSSESTFNPKVVFVLGGPGSGKGTQCSKIVENFGFFHLSAGDLLREEIKSGSENGNMIQTMIKEGRIVPAEVTVNLLKQAMMKNPTGNYLIDGFPRNDENRIVFEKETGITPEFILFFDCPEEEMEKRLLGRNQGRVDDNIETIRKRFKVFVEQSVPVVDFYESQGKVKKVDATYAPDEVFSNLSPFFIPYKKEIESSQTSNSNLTLKSIQESTETLSLKEKNFNPKVVFVLGGPGSGKGTQCSKIVSKYGFVHLSAGDLLREEIKSGSENGNMIQTMIKEGRIVPAEVTVNLLKQAMMKNPTGNYLIDGFPRNDENRIVFEKETGITPEFILFFDCPEEEMEKRLLGRNQGRVDDNIETIKKRFKVFVEQSVPVVDFYESQGKVKKVDATNTPDDVFESLFPLFDPFVAEEKVAPIKIEEKKDVIFKPRVVFVLGGPGSGKGTQCSKIVFDFNFTHLSAGDLLREEIKSGSENGNMIQTMIKEGRIVPAEVTVNLLKQAMMKNPTGNYLIDGFPRNDENRIVFEKETGIEPEFILFFDCPEEVMTQRLLGRNQGRVDDNIETIKKRFKVFVEQSVPVVDFYETKGKVRRVNAAKSPEDVFSSLTPYFLRFLEESLLTCTQHLLHAIDDGDYESYKYFCDAGLTAFEPEARGHLVEGLPFHKFYFDINSKNNKNNYSNKNDFLDANNTTYNNDNNKNRDSINHDNNNNHNDSSNSNNSSIEVDSGNSIDAKPIVRSTISSPKVVIVGDIGFIMYTRITQREDSNYEGKSSAYNETRIWRRVKDKDNDNGDDGDATTWRWKHLHFHRSKAV